jgi:putative hydrolase of the HAD superfamily
MVGNSFKSDIDPVLRLGGRAVHIPFHTMWAHELAEEYEHENLTVIKNFSELLTLL